MAEVDSGDGTVTGTRVAAAAVLLAACTPAATHAAVTTVTVIAAAPPSSTTTTTTVQPPLVTIIPEPVGPSVSSTAYCETGRMASGTRTYVGAVAGNRWPLGTRLRVSDSPLGPAIYTVADRIGHGSDLDFALPGLCRAARHWGRRPVTVEVVP